MIERPAPLGTNVLYKQGSFEIVENYYPGWGSGIGERVHGWTGEETKVTEIVVRAIRTFEVKERSTLPEVV